MRLVSSLVLLATSASVHASGHAPGECAEFIQSPAIYTEIAIPCSGGKPNLSAPVEVNQRLPLPPGGECRVAKDLGVSFRVENSRLMLVNANGVARKIGTLIETPVCQLTDPPDGDVWVGVQLD